MLLKLIKFSIKIVIMDINRYKEKIHIISLK